MNGNSAVPGGVPKCILVFYGSNELIISKKETSLTQLYNEYIENGSNSKLFENIFSKMELKNIATYNIPVHIIDFKIYSDDTIDVVKRKIMMAIKSLLERGTDSESELADYAYDEMYLFSKTPIIFDSNEIYHKMTELAEQGEQGEKQGKDSEFLKNYLMGYSNDGGEPIDPNGVKDVFTTLKKLNASALFKDVSIGQSIPASAYVNPFFFKTSEREISKNKIKNEQFRTTVGYTKYSSQHIICVFCEGCVTSTSRSGNGSSRKRRSAYQNVLSPAICRRNKIVKQFGIRIVKNKIG